MYYSPDGNFVINQHERNKKIFLIYVSEGMSKRLLSALREAEIDALGLKEEAGLKFESKEEPNETIHLN